MSRECPALIPTCAECGSLWLPSEGEPWRAYLGCDESLDQPAEVVLLCPSCSEREFGDDA